MRQITKIFTLLVIMATAVGCFKDEKQGTCMHIALYSQNVSSDPIMKTTGDIEGYAFWVEKGTHWEVSSWEDALEMRITNVDRPAEQLTEPDEFATYDPEAEYQVYYELWSHYTFLVIVDKTNRIYATRFYETPMNLPNVYTQLHLYAHRSSSSTNGWSVTNPFPDDERDPLVPTEPEEEENTDEGDKTEE